MDYEFADDVSHDDDFADEDADDDAPDYYYDMDLKSFLDGAYEYEYDDEEEGEDYGDLIHPSQDHRRTHPPVVEYWHAIFE